jgi:LPPG:FO 2-phospho-L-lactate transferase
MKLVALAGGTGAAKFLRGLCRVIDPADLTIVGNTGDDVELWGLYISPDLDTVGYTLGGLIDETKGWGVKGDTFQCRTAMAALGNDTYFALGDQDLAVHIYRTEQLRGGKSLSEVTESLRNKWSVACRLLPMSDDRVATRIKTPGGWLAFQEYFVRERCKPEVLDVAYDGAERSHPGPGVIEAILAADAVIICPSNPVSSIGPILAVPGIREALDETRAKVSAISPIVGGGAVSGPAGDMMRAKGFEISPLGVAAAYTGFLDQLVIDYADEISCEALRARGVAPVVTESIMGTREREVALARAAIERLG